MNNFWNNLETENNKSLLYKSYPRLFFYSNGEKMTAKNNGNKCLYCGGCVGVCPVQAITLKDTRLIIDPKKCINCGACVSICPVGANKVEK